MIENFKIIKDSTWEKSKIEIYFFDFLVNYKQKRFYNDLNDFKKLSTTLTISETEHDIVYLEKRVEKEINLNLVLEILNTMSEKAKKLKTMPKTIKEALEIYGEEKVRATVLYMSKQKNLTSPRAYFLKALENNWASEILINFKKNETVLNDNIDKLEENKQNYVIESFYKLSSEEQENIEKKVYKNYIKKCGQESKIQKIAFKAGKNLLIAEHLVETNYFNKEITSFKEKVNNELILTENSSIIKDVEEFNQYVNKNIDLYKIMLTLDEEIIITLKKEILKVLGPIFIKKDLTTSKIDKFLVEKFK